MGFWDKYKEILAMPDGSISKEKLYALPWKTQICICYDPETPQTVVNALKYSPDASVIVAAMKGRARILSGEGRNPFHGEKP